ncbi:DUF3899 domain-containing protein [Furfurilactobacillus siliginis]|uniref:DUF3899 domain-containing protein n=1 Tax=Furfurilactobacillus siliginis TaxID=348151 RepID=A0A0R2L2F3_9LACO|nr:DUF3899 domain-containing protein [Furfurilactobacillus siliginis]KRN95977.1 hypothetical protein IV55_GL001648 [Furfurilactobacillus siliginis]GEK29167.1 hypothetical protein LSI01_14780 [Furfurilactobacillus siliginis]
MLKKMSPMIMTLGGVGLFVICCLIAWLAGVSTVQISNVAFMVGLLLLLVGAAMQLSHAHLFVGFRRSRRQKTYKEKDETPQKPISAMEVSEKKNAPLRFSSWNKWIWIAGACCIGVAVLITL